MEASGTSGPLDGQRDFDGEIHAPLDEIRIDGSTQLGLFDAGGKKPTSASLALTGGRFDLMDGKAYRKGDVIVLQVVAVVDTVTLKDKTDRKVGVVTACEQQHKAYISDVRVIENTE